MKNKTVAFYTLGCKVNSFDTEAMTELFEKAGYTPVGFESAADIYVVNTCTVTHLGDRKSRNMLRRAKKRNPNAVVIAAGCYAQTAPEKVAEIPEVDLVIGTQDRLKIVEMAEKFLFDREKCSYVRDNLKGRDYEDLTISDSKEHTRAFMKIQEGCDQFCTYCIVPYARGRVRSRPPESVLSEAQRLVQAGFMEIVLTGIHIASYGKDLAEAIDLIGLIEALDQMPGIRRIRLGSLEPKILTEDAVMRLSKVKSLCPHFHLSLQSGSDTVLKRMHRHYTTAEYRDITERIRRYFKYPAITTDIMTGFPGESDREFEETLAFAEQIGFYQIHVFKYSRRTGTPAAEMSDQIPEPVKTQRSHRLIVLSEQMEQAFCRINDGQEAEVLFEQPDGRGMIMGHTPNYLPVFLREDEKTVAKSVRLGYYIAVSKNGWAVCSSDRKENAMAEDCLFCRIAAGEIPSEKVYEDEKIYAFKDIDPQAPVHVIIIPKAHYANILSVSAGDDIITHLHMAANRIALKLGLADEGFRLVTNIGEAGGQTVQHLHYHLLGGRSMQWPPG